MLKSIFASLAALSLPLFHPSEVAPSTRLNQRNEIMKQIAETARAYNIPESLMMALVRVESGFNPMAVSPKFARGLAQITEIHIGTTCPFVRSKEQLFDIELNLRCGAIILRDTLTAQPTIKLALSAYNGGNRSIRNGEIVYKESREYTEKVLSYYEEYERGNS